MSGDPCLHYDCTNSNSFGYCKTTACINPKYSNIGTAQYGQGVQKRVATNADRIRSMSDEELAKWLERIRLCCSTDLCGKICPLVEVCYSSAEAPKETLDWLKQEAE